MSAVTSPLWNELTSDERRDLELRYDGPITVQAIYDAIARRGQSLCAQTEKSLRNEVSFAAAQAGLFQPAIDLYTQNIIVAMQDRDSCQPGRAHDDLTQTIAHMTRQRAGLLEQQQSWRDAKLDAERRLEMLTPVFSVAAE